MAPSESPGEAQLCQTTLWSLCLKSLEPATQGLSHANSGKQSLLHHWLLTGLMGSSSLQVPTAEYTAGCALRLGVSVSMTYWVL